MANNISSKSNLPTIAGIVSQSGDGFDNNSSDFDILLEALKTADLVEALDNTNADFSVFAPTDEAFIQLARDFGYEGMDEAEALDVIVNALSELGNGDPVSLLRDILLYHVSPDAKSQAEIKTQTQVDTLLEGANFQVEDGNLVDNEPDLIDPSFIGELADIEAANGTIQGIDRVLIPIDIPGNELSNDSDVSLPTIAGIVSQSGDEFDNNSQDFDILLEALKTADLVDAVDDPNAELTVFAPTDAAFIKLAQDFGYQGTDEGEAFSAIANALTDLGDGSPIPLLQDILLYHVSPGVKNQAEIKTQTQVDTLLEGANFQVEDGNLVDNEPDLTNPSLIDELANVEAANGIIQGIDRVLIPIDIPGNDITGGSESNVLVGIERNNFFNRNDDFILFNNSAYSIILNLDNIADFVSDLLTGETSISFGNGSNFGNLSIQESDNSAAIFGGENILAEVSVSGFFYDGFNFT
ncbi:MAG: fasciclin domain-containing protein [Cyanobacteria bacterium P01_D01_bin.50]